MDCRSRPHYRSGRGWIWGVAFLGTLTRPARPAQGFTCVRCCSTPLGFFPTPPRDRAVAFGLWLLPTRSTEDLHLLSRVHAWHTKDKPFGWPQERPSLTAAARDGEHITLVGTKGRRAHHAGRDERMLAARVEPKNGLIS
jgi:hypothetical protein